MRNLLTTSILLIAGLTSYVQALELEFSSNRVGGGKGLSDLLGELEALEAAEIGNEAKGNEAKGTTKTIIISEAGAGGTGNAAVQLPFVTRTTFGSGPAPTFTITPPVMFLTQETSITVGNAAAQSQIPAGVGIPGAVGSGNAASAVLTGVSSATFAGVIVTPSSLAAGETPPGAAVAGINPPSGVVGTGVPQAAALSVGSPGAVGTGLSPAAALAVGSPGAIVSGNGVPNVDGSCNCQCLCGAGSFNIAPMANPPQGVRTTLATIAVPNLATFSTSIIAQTQAGGAALSPSLALASSLTSATALFSLQTASTPSANALFSLQTASTPSASALFSLQTVSTPSASALFSLQALSTPSATALFSLQALSTPTASAQAQTAAPAVGSSTTPGFSSLELSLGAASTPVAAAAENQASSTDPINISTFSLTSSLLLGNLATPAAKR